MRGDGRLIFGGFFPRIEAKFLSHNIHVFGRLNTDPNGVGSHSNDGDFNLISDENFLTCLSGQHKHDVVPFIHPLNSVSSMSRPGDSAGSGIRFLHTSKKASLC